MVGWWDLFAILCKFMLECLKQCAPSDLQFLLKMHFILPMQVLFSYMLKIVVFLSKEWRDGGTSLHIYIYLLLNFMIPFQYSFHV